jgi:hypothetical protein
VLSALGLKFSIEQVKAAPAVKRATRSPAKKTVARKDRAKGPRAAVRA